MIRAAFLRIGFAALAAGWLRPESLTVQAEPERIRLVRVSQAEMAEAQRERNRARRAMLDELDRQILGA